MTSSLHSSGMLKVCPDLMNCFKAFHQFLAPLDLRAIVLPLALASAAAEGLAKC